MPADIRKEGPSFDLPIALGMLAAKGDIDKESLEGVCVVGELALSGQVRRVRGVLPIALQARNQGCEMLLVPAENAEEAAVVGGIRVYGIDNLRQAADFLLGDRELDPVVVDAEMAFGADGNYDVDFADVKGQESAKRALEVAVASSTCQCIIGSEI